MPRKNNRGRRTFQGRATHLSRNPTLPLQEQQERKIWTLHDLADIRALTPIQQAMCDAFERGQHLIAYGSPGTGKAQPLSAKILTPDGWKLMGAIKPGDNIITPEGNISRVIEVFPQGEKDIYTILFSDGASTTACLDHLWECYVPSDRWSTKASPKKIITTREIKKFLDKKKNILENGEKFPANISIELIKPIEKTEKYLPIHPYILGVLLGDGGFTTNTPSITTEDGEIVANISNLLPQDYCINKIESSLYGYAIRQRDPHVKGISGCQKNEFTITLKSLTLHGKRSHEKFIPQIYKEGSIEQRLLLIQGLMDTDGTVDHRTGSGISLSTTSYKLAKDFQEIIWSLGGKSKISPKKTSYTYKNIKKNGKPSYNVSVSYKHPQKLFSLSRKKEKSREVYEEKQLRRQIVSIEFLKKEQAQCLLIDDPKHLYITDDYIITHNTFLSLYLALSEILCSYTPQTNIIIVRSAVQSREIGFTPGTLEEKMALYETPYRDILYEIIGRYSAYDAMKNIGLITFYTTSFLRSLTFNNAVIFLDEVQNCTFNEIYTVLTRTGENSRIIVSGDLSQNDLEKKNEQTGMKHLLRVAETMEEFSLIQFTREDIIRSSFVKKFIIACEDVS